MVMSLLHRHSVVSQDRYSQPGEGAYPAYIGGGSDAGRRRSDVSDRRVSGLSAPGSVGTAVSKVQDKEWMDFYRGLHDNPSCEYYDDYLFLKYAKRPPTYAPHDWWERNKRLEEEPPTRQSEALGDRYPTAVPAVRQSRALSESSTPATPMTRSPPKGATAYLDTWANPSSDGLMAWAMEMLNGPPAKRYVCDGQSVFDEKGQAVGRVQPMADGSVELTSPNGRPWLRHDRSKHCILNVDPQQKQEHNMRPEATVVVAILDAGTQRVYNGDRAVWDPKNPPTIYEYTKETGQNGMVTKIQEASSRRDIANITRPGEGLYPASISIAAGVPYHLLLLALFAM